MSSLCFDIVFELENRPPPCEHDKHDAMAIVSGVYGTVTYWTHRSANFIVLGDRKNGSSQA
jgi:hypothetical protein